MKPHTISTEAQIEQIVKDLQEKLFYVQKKAAVSLFGKVKFVGEYRVTDNRIYLIDLSGYPVYEAPRHIKADKVSAEPRKTESLSLLDLVTLPERAGYGPLRSFFSDVMEEQGWELQKQIRYVRNQESFPNVVSRHSVTYKKRFFAEQIYQYRHRETGFILKTGSYRRWEFEASDIRNTRLSLKTIMERGYDLKTAEKIRQAWNDLKTAVTAKSEEYIKQLKAAASFRPEYGELLNRHGWQVEVEHAVRARTGQPVVMISCTYDGRTRTCRKEHFIKKLWDMIYYFNRRNKEKEEELVSDLEHLLMELYPEFSEWIK